MASKFIVFAAFIAATSAIVAPAYSPYGYGGIAKVGVAAPLYGGYAPAIAKVAAPIIAKVTDDYDPNPQYSYSYDINDALTGDSKSQHESRSGDVVTGAYSLVEPDGTRRVVEYTADPVNGFNAVVHKEPLATKVIAAAPIAKIASPYGYPGYGAPIAKIATPLGYPGLARPYYH